MRAAPPLETLHLLRMVLEELPSIRALQFPLDPF